MITLGFRLIVVALLAFILLPAVVACIAAFDSRAIIAFPPQGFSWRWFHRALNYEDFRIGFGDVPPDVEIGWSALPALSR